jgi:putative sigma-54 modulation protein
MKNVTISGHHLLLTDAIKSLTNHKFRKLFRHAPDMIGAHVELIQEFEHTGHSPFIARARLSIPGNDIVASAASEDLYKSLDLLIRKLDGQVRRRHSLWRSKRKDAIAA